MQPGSQLCKIKFNATGLGQNFQILGFVLYFQVAVGLALIYS